MAFLNKCDECRKKVENYQLEVVLRQGKRLRALGKQPPIHAPMFGLSYQITTTGTDFVRVSPAFSLKEREGRPAIVCYECSTEVAEREGSRFLRDYKGEEGRGYKGKYTVERKIGHFLQHSTITGNIQWLDKEEFVEWYDQKAKKWRSRSGDHHTKVVEKEIQQVRAAVEAAE